MRLDAGTFAANGPVVQALRTRFASTLAIYAFGSQVQGTATADSDLDLAILVAGYANKLALWNMATELAGLAGCPVDLLN